MQVHWPGRAHGVFSGFYDVSQDLEHGGGNIVRREREWTKPHVLTSHRMVSSVYKEKGGWLGGSQLCGSAVVGLTQRVGSEAKQSCLPHSSHKNEKQAPESPSPLGTLHLVPLSSKSTKLHITPVSRGLQGFLQISQKQPQYSLLS